METPNYKLGGEIMINRTQLDQEIIEAYKSIANSDFAAKDLIKLHENADKGSRTSAEMLMALWKKKVNPYLLPEWQIKTEKN